MKTDEEHAAAITKASVDYLRAWGARNVAFIEAAYDGVTIERIAEVSCLTREAVLDIIGGQR